MRRDLLSWYDASRRRLPWRESPSPYRTWISEIMLQQTQVATVLPYYERFIERFPDVKSLAAASEAEVLRLWAGLGYYSRARNLLAAARVVVRERGGRFPDTIEGLLRLPGIGRYTAGAVLSIAFGKPAPVLDGNVIRVLSRLLAIRADTGKADTQRRLWKIADAWLDRGRPGDWNQALMELGALVCVPESPRCADCPVAAHCVARKLGLQERLPRTGAAPKPAALAWRCLWVERGGRVLLWKRGEEERLLPGHWGLPEARRLRLRPGALLGRVRHSITRHRITLELRRAPAPRGPLPPEARWVPEARLREHLVSSLWLKACDKALEVSA